MKDNRTTKDNLQMAAQERQFKIYKEHVAQKLMQSDMGTPPDQRPQQLLESNVETLPDSDTMDVDSDTSTKAVAQDEIQTEVINRNNSEVPIPPARVTALSQGPHVGAAALSLGSKGQHSTPVSVVPKNPEVRAAGLESNPLERVQELEAILENMRRENELLKSKAAPEPDSFVQAMEKMSSKIDALSRKIESLEEQVSGAGSGRCLPGLKYSKREFISAWIRQLDLHPVIRSQQGCHC
ncbi:Cytidylate kinase [Frankliniella fusca]|uniref:Cytidylate kinase n=1 Tax=Frankliniella fusca TaxID=407009 RepID=A0AAE1LT54_9NEOP|nr:Cytidylate kinase [Frankliniella fusca]